MTNVTSPDSRPADLDPETETEAAHAFAAASAALSDGPAPVGWAETVFNRTAALAHAVRAGQADPRGLFPASLEGLYREACEALEAWRLAAGCEDWVLAPSNDEVAACAEASAQLHKLRGLMLDLASEVDTALHQQLERLPRVA
jgi:hypothetical protein